MQLEPELLKQCWFLTGPTASGKTEVGLLLAERLGAEIVALDSMTVYRGMDIGTAKPTPEQQARVPHHLLDVIAPHEEFSVAEYLESAGNVCREILSRGRIPLFVGGSGLYLRSLIRGVFEGPAADWDYRRKLESQSKDHPPGWLHEQLRRVDADSAESLHPNDSRRLIRALEVYHVTGKPLSAQQQQIALPAELQPEHVYWISPPRAWLYERINHRAAQMFAGGLIDEVRRLWESPLSLGHTARQALGYKEVLDHLSGELSREHSLEVLSTRTRQFAKRQHTWFRNLQECREIPADGSETAAQLADSIASLE
jgi:tRNA dimethylallyltransferase